MTSATTWATQWWVRAAVPIAVLVLLTWYVGTGPFIEGLHSVSLWVLTAAAAIGLVTTCCCAWRWRVVANGLGVQLAFPAAVAAYYRSLFLNVSLPGGFIGDIHRGVSHGREVTDVGRGLRAVIWERSAGQVTQVVVTVAVLLLLPSPVRRYVLPVIVIGAVVIGLVALTPRWRPRSTTGRLATLRGVVSQDLRGGLFAGRAWVWIGLASAVAIAGYALTFVIAARASGISLSAWRLIPLALLVMLGMVLPSIGGWGIREGAAAWVFAAAGLGADQGVATAVCYGLMGFAAAIPGLAVLAAMWARGLRRRSAPGRLQAFGSIPAIEHGGAVHG